LNRTPEKAQEIADAVGNGTVAGSMSESSEYMKEADILINTTPVGMADTETEGQAPIDASLLHSGLTVLEVIGKPQDTQLVLDSQAAGCQIVYGYRMLLWQGVLKFKYYTDVEPPIEVMEEAMEKRKSA
jgi:shikimate 5-dehydrogenase